MKQYKVIKEFGCAQKGDVLKENEEGLFELSVECIFCRKAIPKIKFVHYAQKSAQGGLLIVHFCNISKKPTCLLCKY